jgi:uncharacterized protein (TIGR02266 family)
MATTSVSTKTVVIADDTAFVRDRFRTAVENAGHRAVVVKSAAELLGRVRADLDQIDLIVLDLRLPRAPGVDLVRSIRKLDKGRLPILVFSGTIANADEVRDLAALGVAGYVNEYSAVQLNLSHGGIAIRTTSPLDNGTRIRVRFRMPGSKRDLDAEGRIVWSDRRVGMGVQFDRVDQASQAIIDNFVDAHFFSNRKA